MANEPRAGSVPIYLVRHGEAAAAWGAERDPGLSARGQRQAAAVAETLMSSVDREVAVISSPMRRARETAMPLATALGIDIRIDEAFREVPAPVAFDDRVQWLQGFLSGSWREQPAELLAWRRRLLERLAAMQQPTVVFTHFVVVNAVVGHLTAASDVVCFRPDNASVTELCCAPDGLQLVRRGAELDTTVN